MGPCKYTCLASDFSDKSKIIFWNQWQKKQPPKLVVFLIVIALKMININDWNANVAVPQDSIIIQMTWFITETLL